MKVFLKKVSEERDVYFYFEVRHFSLRIMNSQNALFSDVLYTHSTIFINNCGKKVFLPHIHSVFLRKLIPTEEIMTLMTTMSSISLKAMSLICILWLYHCNIISSFYLPPKTNRRYSISVQLRENQKNKCRIINFHLSAEIIHEKTKSMDGYSDFVRNNPMSDKIPARNFHHVEFYCGDATNSYKRFMLGMFF